MEWTLEELESLAQQLKVALQEENYLSVPQEEWAEDLLAQADRGEWHRWNERALAFVCQVVVGCFKECN